MDSGREFHRLCKEIEMEQLLTFEQFQKANIERAKRAFPDQCLTPEFLAVAIAGEAGELCNLIKKVMRGDYSYKERQTDIVNEIADVMTYCDLLMSVFNEDTAHRLRVKWDEVSQRRKWQTLEKATGTR
jgi:NTP pyrophosphatase (non-canonical NTP hydrolase)